VPAAFFVVLLFPFLQASSNPFFLMALEARLSYFIKWAQDSTCDLSMCQIQPSQMKDLLCAIFAPPPTSQTAADPDALTGPRVPVRRLCFGGNKMTPAAIAELAEFLRFSVVAKEKIECLDFAHDRFGNFYTAPQARNSIGDDGVAQIATVLAIAGNLRELCFAGNNVGPKGLRSILDVFEKQRALGKRPIEILDVNTNNIGPEGAKMLAKALRSPACTLKTLKVSQNRIGFAGVIEIARSLKTNSTLTQLDISWNMCRKEEYGENTAASQEGVQVAMEFADILGQQGCTLESLTLDGNLLGNNGAMLILKALQDNPGLQMKHLSVGASSLDDSAATHFAAFVRDSAMLLSLDLSRNHITSEGATAFKEALANNTTLTALSLRDNHVIDPETLEVMRTMMQKNAASLRTNMTKARMARLIPTTSESHFFGQSPESKEASKRESTVGSSVSSKKKVRNRRLTASSKSGNQSEGAGQNAGEGSEKRSRAPSLTSNTSESVKTSSPDIDSMSAKSIKSSSGSVLRGKRPNHSHSPSPPPNVSKVVSSGEMRTRAHTETGGVSISSKPTKRSSETCLAKQNKGLMVKTDVEGIIEKEQKREKQREEYERKRKEDAAKRASLPPIGICSSTRSSSARKETKKVEKTKPEGKVGQSTPERPETPASTSAPAKEAPSNGIQQSDASSMTRSSKHHHKHHHSSKHTQSKSTSGIEETAEVDPKAGHRHQKSKKDGEEKNQADSKASGELEKSASNLSDSDNGSDDSDDDEKV